MPHLHKSGLWLPKELAGSPSLASEDYTTTGLRWTENTGTPELRLMTGGADRITLSATQILAATKLNMGGLKVENVAAATVGGDAANKTYVDNTAATQASGAVSTHAALTDPHWPYYLNDARHDITGRHPISVLGDGTGFGLKLRLTYSASTTWTKSNYTGSKVVVTVVGGGGAGGGAAITAASQSSCGSGGGGGTVGQKVIDWASLGATETVTVATFTSGTAGANGSAGGTSSFGAHLSAPGGAGGVMIAANTTNRMQAGGAGGVAGSGISSEVFQMGGAGGPALAIGALSWGGMGGHSAYGLAGGVTTGNAVGTSTGTRGNGGGGANNGASQATARAGGTGSAGIVIVDIYA